MAISREFLQFFDKAGNDLNPNYDWQNDAWYSKMFFPKISANLNESENVFILENVLNLEPTKAQLGFGVNLLPVSNTYFTSVNSFTISGAYIVKYAFQFQYLNTSGAYSLITVYDNGSGMLLDQNGNNVTYFYTEEFGTIHPSGSSQFFLPQIDQSGLNFQVRALIYDNLGNEDSSDWFNYGNVLAFPVPPAPVLPAVSTQSLVYPSSNGSNRKFRARFLEGSSEFFLFTIDHTNGDFPLVVKSDSVVIEMIRDGSLDAADPATGKRMVTSFLSQAMQFNIGCSGEEGIYERSMVIEEILIDGNGNISVDTQIGIAPDDGSTVKIFMLIDFYAEIEGEDIRYRNILENFGKKINAEDTYIFREIDIEEDLPDWQVLNYKRKELLLEGDNIYPYMGSYKGLLNAINYFGYFDLQLKEYWLNVDTTSPNYKTYKQVVVTNNTNGGISFSERLLPSTNYKKTALFGLFYPLNEETGEYDEYGLPLTEPTSLFTPDEVIYKLFGLRNLLIKDYLPFNARIIDICGEGIYFYGYNFKHWTDSVTILERNQNITPTFTVTSNNLIIDLRSYNITNNNPGLTGRQNIIISDYQDTIVGTFNDYAQPLLYGDDPEHELVGCPFSVTNTTFNYVWDDLTGTWDSYLHFAWDDLNNGNFYECEWSIEKLGSIPFNQSSGRDTIVNLMSWSSYVPFIGEYNIILKLYDTNNNVSTRVIQNAINVVSFEVEISAIYRSQQFRETWDSQTESWDSQNSSWSDPIISANATWDDFQLPWDSLSWYRYLDQNWVLNDGVYDQKFALAHLGTNSSWDDFSYFDWDDMANTSWDMLEAHGDTYCGFIISSFAVGGTITIEGLGTIFQMMGTYGASWEGLCRELNQTNIAGFSDFFYTIIGGESITGDFDGDYNEDHLISYDTQTPLATVRYIHAAAKHHGISFLYAFQYQHGMGSEYENPKWGNSYPLVNSLLWDSNESLPLIDRPPLWNYLYRTYQEWKGLFELNNIQTTIDWYTAGSMENYRIPVNAAIAGYFQWQDIRMQNSYFEIQTGVPMIFNYDRCKIPGKQNARWKVFDENLTLLCDVSHSFLMWTPSSSGRIVIQLDIEDANGNLSSQLLTNL